MIAAEMAKLETRESIDAVQAAEDREDDVPKGRLNTAARRISLRDESLRLPAGLRCPCGNRPLTPGNSPTSVFSTHAQTAPVSVTVHDL
jgi:hypothetical protein